MGFVTVISVLNDAMGEFKKDPAAFGKAILDGINEANTECKEVSIPLGGYCNYINVQPSVHMEDHTVYLNYGGGLTNVSAWSREFQDTTKHNPKFAEKCVMAVGRIGKEAKIKLFQQTS